MSDNIKIHASSIVSEKADIGKGTCIWQHCIIQGNTILGKNCLIGANVFIEDGVILGNGVKVKNNVAIYKGVKCEDDVFLGPNCVFTNVINPRSFINRKNEFKDTIVKRGATIGANATIICGNEIGEYAMVGAGAVVTKNVPAYALMVGNPAKRVGYVCRCGCKLNNGTDAKLFCRNCGMEYMLNDDQVCCLDS